MLTNLNNEKVSAQIFENFDVFQKESGGFHNGS